MIEVSDEWLESKRKEAAGEAPFTEDRLLDALVTSDSRQFYKLPPRWQTIVGYHSTAKRLKAQMGEVA